MYTCTKVSVHAWICCMQYDFVSYVAPSVGIALYRESLLQKAYIRRNCTGREEDWGNGTRV